MNAASHRDSSVPSGTVDGCSSPSPRCEHSSPDRPTGRLRRVDSTHPRQRATASDDSGTDPTVMAPLTLTRMPGRSGRLRASLRLARYRTIVSAQREELLNARIDDAKARLVRAWSTLGPLPAGVEAEIRIDGTPRFTATVGRGRTRSRLRTNSLDEAVAWLEMQRIERDARKTKLVRVSVGKWRADWWIPARHDSRRWAETVMHPLLEQHAERIALPPRIGANVAQDRSLTFSATVRAGAYSDQRSFRSLADAVR